MNQKKYVELEGCLEDDKFMFHNRFMIRLTKEEIDKYVSNLND